MPAEFRGTSDRHREGEEWGVLQVSAHSPLMNLPLCTYSSNKCKVILWVLWISATFKQHRRPGRILPLPSINFSSGSKPFLLFA